jgi:hypothetical protein
MMSSCLASALPMPYCLLSLSGTQQQLQQLQMA